MALLLATAAAAAATNPVANATVRTPDLCVYRGPAPFGCRNNPAFAAWLGIPLVWGEDFMPTTDWDNLDGGGWQIRPWSAWKQALPGRRFVLSVPLLPGAWNLSGPKTGTDAGKAVSLEAGAQGDYNRHFKLLAERLVKAGLGDTILRLGWEMNGGWYAWRAKGHEAAFAGYWRQIVTTMRAVPGAAFRFNFNPTCGVEQFASDQAWPGDEAVDEVGLDVYDQCWQPGTYPIPTNAAPADVLERQAKAWDHSVHGDRGLLFWRDFARAHGKPFSIPEWGVWKRPDGHGGGDDPEFIEKMHTFLMEPTNGVTWHCYFDIGTSASRGEAHHQLSPGPDGTQVSTFPAAATAFRRLFGSHPGVPTSHPEADAGGAKSSPDAGKSGAP